MVKALTPDQPSTLAGSEERKCVMKLLCWPQNVVHVSVFMLCLVCCAGVRAADGYEAIGCITYTRFSTLGQATHKNLMMFDVKVHGSQWRIRTEPVIEGKGIGFYEASYSTNDFVLRITGLDAAYRSSESPFQSLRKELKKSQKEDVFFENPVLNPAVYSSAQLLSTTSAKTFNRTGKPDSSVANNVAVAYAIKGEYPPVDSSFVAFLWFAFTSPRVQNDGKNNLLLQTWDDGSHPKIRFRRAQWKQSVDPPNLVSSAVYGWMGRQLLPDGALVDIGTSGNLGEVAARYDVDITTNLSGF